MADGISVGRFVDYKTVAVVAGVIINLLVGGGFGLWLSRGAEERAANTARNTAQEQDISNLQWKVIELETRQQSYIIDKLKNHDERLNRLESRRQ